MKRLLTLTIVAALAAGAVGCRSRGATCRPCVPAPVCGPGIETYTTPGTITTQVPSLAPMTGVPTQINPGPEQYVPSTP